MRLQGPAVFLAQGYGKKGWKTLEECAHSAAELGYRGMQVQLWNGGPIDLEKAAASPAYCDELQGIATRAGCPIVSLANHCDTQLVQLAPQDAKLHAWPAPAELRGNVKGLREWAHRRALLSVDATANFGFDRFAAFSGSSIFDRIYPWPQRPAGLVEAAFNLLASAWLPVFEAAEKRNVNVCFELHPGEDLMDGDTFNRFLPYVEHHPRCCILLDLSHMVLAGMTNRNMLDFIEENSGRIRMFHVKDGEFVPTAGGGAYGSFNPWNKRQGRFRSTGDGQIDYAGVFEKLRQKATDIDWAVLEWEDCAGKGWRQGVREGAQYIQAWLDGRTPPAQTAAEPHDDGAFDDFAQADVDRDLIAELLGIYPQEVNTTAAA